MMDINIFDKDFTLLYGNPYLNSLNLIKTKSKEIACLVKKDYIIVGHSKELEIPYMLSILDRIRIDYLKDYFKFFTYMDNKFFNGYILDEAKSKTMDENFKMLKKQKVKFDVEEKIRAILSDKGRVLSSYAQGSIICHPQFIKSTQLYIQYSIPRTEIEMRHSMKKFFVIDKPKTVCSYAFLPLQMPITLTKYEKNWYTLKSCLSEKSNIKIKFPISKKTYNTVAHSEIGQIKIMDEYIEWSIKNTAFEEAEIKYDFDVLMNEHEVLGPIQISFSSKFFSLSELIIKDVRDVNGMTKEAWVSYVVKSENYEVRN